jgi:hypothetical protein
MAHDASTTWLWLLGLGAWHGLNPGMGWLFAVALGMQERRAIAVWRALLPLGVGHALAVAAAIVPAVLLGLALPPQGLKWIVAGALLVFGVYRLLRHTHPRWGGMRVRMRDLVLWSLLMASAHGAGLMVLPLLLPDEPAEAQAMSLSMASAPAHAGADHAHHAAMAQPTSGIGGFAAMAVHTAGYLLVTGLIALLVYAWAGLRLLRAAWINLDVLWAGALIITAVLTPLL